MACKTRLIAALTLAGTLALQSVPTMAHALTSAELKVQAEQARVELAALGEQVMALGEDLYETQYQLEVTGQQIEETKEAIEEREDELSEAQEVLSKRVSSNYKSGKIGLLSIVLESSNYEELVSNFYYACKVYKSDTEAIAHVREVRAMLEEEEASLEEQEKEQKELLAQQTEQKEKLEKQEAEQAAYVENLDAQVIAKVEEERQAELERQRRLAAEAEAAARKAAAEAEEAARREAAAQAEKEQQQLNEEGAEASTGDAEASEDQVEQVEQVEVDDTGEVEDDGGSTVTVQTPQFSTPDYSATSSLTQSQRNIILSAAASQLGVPYVFGSCNPGVSFDCSGFTMYCYSQAGISLDHSSVAQCAETKSISFSQLQPGDLVFWIGTGGAATGGSHVAIYYGNGNIIHSNYAGVEIIPLYGVITGYGTV